jgi:tetratricopeptide (TPR) repeat protein
METWRPALNEALALFEQQQFADALDKFLPIRHQLAPPGVDTHIFLCLRALKRYEEMIPYLEAVLAFPPNDQNAELWRMLGLLYLHNERDVEKAVTAWKQALQLNPLLAQQHNGLQIVYLYDTMKQAGSQPTIDFVDLETGNFGIRFST